MFVITPEGPSDGPAIEVLLDQAFGADRHRKVSYRYRQGLDHEQDLALVAREGDRLVGTIRYWRLTLDGQPALLLGPLAIDTERRGRGIGRTLVNMSLALAAKAGFRLVFLVGDPVYYEALGFQVVPENVVMPDEQPWRLQWRGLAGATLPPGGGTLRHWAAGGPVEVGEERPVHRGEALVARHGLGHLADAVGDGGGDARLADHAVQAPHQGTDAKDDRLAAWQPAQRLALDPQPEALARVA